MNFVEPIRDRKKIAQIKNLLRGQKDPGALRGQFSGQRLYYDVPDFEIGLEARKRIRDDAYHLG